MPEQPLFGDDGMTEEGMDSYGGDSIGDAFSKSASSDDNIYNTSSWGYSYYTLQGYNILNTNTVTAALQPVIYFPDASFANSGNGQPYGYGNPVLDRSSVLSNLPVTNRAPFFGEMTKRIPLPVLNDRAYTAYPSNRGNLSFLKTGTLDKSILGKIGKELDKLNMPTGYYSPAFPIKKKNTADKKTNAEKAKKNTSDKKTTSNSGASQKPQGGSSNDKDAAKGKQSDGTKDTQSRPKGKEEKPKPNGTTGGSGGSGDSTGGHKDTQGRGQGNRDGGLWGGTQSIKRRPVQPPFIFKKNEYIYAPTEYTLEESAKFNNTKRYIPQNNLALGGVMDEHSSLKIFVYADEGTIKLKRNNVIDLEEVKETISLIYLKNGIPVDVSIIYDPVLGKKKYDNFIAGKEPLNVQVIKLYSNATEKEMAGDWATGSTDDNNEYVNIRGILINANEYRTTNKKDISYAIGFSAAHEVLHGLLKAIERYLFQANADKFATIIGYNDGANKDHIKGIVNLINKGDVGEKITTRDNFAKRRETILEEIVFLILTFLRYIKENNGFSKSHNNDEMIRNVIIRAIYNIQDKRRKK